jgi:hypothetical protein
MDPIEQPSSLSDFELAAALREWRARRAREEEVPAYIVLTNALLAEITRTRPSTEDALGQLRGMGPGRLARYGGEILAVVSKAGFAAQRCGRDDVAEAEPGTDPPQPVSENGGSGPEIRAPFPYRVVIEYHLEDAVRRRLVEELEVASGPILASMQAALAQGPARVSIRIEAERDAA